MGKVLSMDDSRVMRTMIRGAAEALGLGFLEAPDGDSGLEVMKANVADIDLVCLDVNMPGIDGLEVLREMKRDDNLKDLPVMMVTTESCRNMIIESIKAGATNYVCKSFTQEELMTKMVDSMQMGF